VRKGELIPVLILNEEQAKIILRLMRRVEDGLGIGDLREDDWALFDVIEAAFPPTPRPHGGDGGPGSLRGRHAATPDRTTARGREKND
jgi:hypothetical protein